MLFEQIPERLAAKAARGELVEDAQPPPSLSTHADFATVDYMGFSFNRKWNEEYLHNLSTLDRSALGSSGTRVATGESKHHLALESRLAAHHGGESALLMNSGFDANVGLWSSLPQPGDIVLLDELVHASIRTGLKLCRAARVLEWRHNMVDDLRAKIEAVLEVDAVRAGQSNVFVAVESVYSMDGDMVPLRDVVETVRELLPKGNGYIIIDEAHSTGVYGPQGRGLTCQLGLENEVTIQVHTFGKGMGCSGAVLVLPRIIRSYLMNFAGPVIYSTAMPFSSVVAINTAYDFLESAGYPAQQTHLFALSRYLQTALLDAGFELIHDGIIDTPLMGVRVDRPREVMKRLRDRGYAVLGIPFPVVARGKERLRVAVHVHNTYAQADGLIQAMLRTCVEGPQARL